ncbi:hypothetical protein [Pseudomonas putida]
MSTKEIRISLADIDQDSSPEVFIEYFEKNEFEFSITVSSSNKNGVYDKVNGKGDANGDGKIDESDNPLYIDLAQAALKIMH